MSIDEIDISSGIDRIVKYCPSCGSKDVAVYDDLLKCHRCYRLYGAFELDVTNEDGE